MLNGKRIILTQATDSAQALSDLLRENGAEVLHFPMITTQTRQLKPSEIETLQQSNGADWWIFTSKNGVKSFFELRKKDTISEKFTKKIAVIGQKTADTLSEFGYTAEFINPGNTSEEFLPKFIEEIANTQPSILLIQGSLAPDFIRKKISEKTKITRIDVYETKICDTKNQILEEILIQKTFDSIVFTSPLAFQALHTHSAHWLSVENKAVCIGSVTAEALGKAGIGQFTVAKTPSVTGLFDAILDILVEK